MIRDRLMPALVLLGVLAAFLSPGAGGSLARATLFLPALWLGWVEPAAVWGWVHW